jgi:hypothetical protein
MTTDQIVRNNPALLRALNAHRDQIERQSDLQVTDDEWADLLPLGVAKIVDQLPPGPGPFPINFRGVTIGRRATKTIRIQRSPDGSSTATITE